MDESTCMVLSLNVYLDFIMQNRVDNARLVEKAQGGCIQTLIKISLGKGHSI